jgi:hypothetical protein
VLADENFDVIAVQYDDVITPGTITRNTRKDAVWDDTVGATVNRTAQLTGALHYQSLDPSIAIMNDDIVQYVSDGVARINCYGNQNAKRINVQCSHLVGASSTDFVSWVPGSLAAYFYNQSILWAGRHNPAVDIAPFSTADHTNAIYVRRASVWTEGTDISCISPWNSNSAQKRAGTLITPRHFIGNVHYEITPGQTIRFVAMDNTVVDRVVTSNYRVPDPYFDASVVAGQWPWGTDICIGTLNADVPASIKPARMFPTTFKQYLPSVYRLTEADLATGAPYYIPLPSFSRQQELYLLELDQQVWGCANSVQGPKYETGTNGIRSNIPLLASYTGGGWRSGDSGGAIFFSLNNETLLLSTNAFAGPDGAGGVLFAGYSYPAIQSYISPYTLTFANLSAFTLYTYP